MISWVPFRIERNYGTVKTKKKTMQENMQEIANSLDEESVIHGGDVDGDIKIF